MMGDWIMNYEVHDRDMEELEKLMEDLAREQVEQEEG